MFKLYWKWRLSWVSRPWYVLKTFLFLHWNARKIAIHLDDCMRTLGRMEHSNKEEGYMMMPIRARSDLTKRQWQTLPAGWKWRKD